jgi:phage baseplate assembly protein W
VLIHNDNPFVGIGWAYPISVNAVGGIATVGGVDEIEQAMFLILVTTPGERPMRPEFGCPLVDFLFDPIDSTTCGSIERTVGESLRRWEPRVDVQAVDVVIDPDADGRVFIDIKYVIRDTYDTRSLVFPFYLIPDRH